jgi:hypothetical protein
VARITPAGYMQPREAINAVGRELYPTDWVGDEDQAPAFQFAPGQIIPSGSGAGSMFVYRQSRTATKHEPVKYEPARMADTEEYRRKYEANVAARKRWQEVSEELLRRLEAGEVHAAVLDPWTGAIHKVPHSFWRRNDAERMLIRGQAPIPYSSNYGTLLLELFQAKAAKVAKRQLTASEMNNAVQRLKTSPNLTRSQQRKVILDLYPHMTDRKWRELLRIVGSRPPGKKRRR